MPDVEDDAIGGTIQGAVDSQRQLNDPEVRRQMPAGLRDSGDELVANLSGELLQLRVIQRLDVAGRFYGIENAIGHLAHHLHYIASGCKRLAPSLEDSTRSSQDQR